MAVPAAVAESLNNVQKKQEHKKVLESIAKALAQLPSVLKGGSALIFCYGNERFSEDLDYNASKQFNLDSKVKSALQGLGATDVTIEMGKNTDTTKRYFVTYSYGSIKGFKFKIETSFRDVNESYADEVTTVKGIKVYTIESIAKQKLYAMRDEPPGGRVAPRDLEDIRFIVEHHKAHLTPETIAKIKAMTAGDGAGLIRKYESAYQMDNTLTTSHLLATVGSLVEMLK